MIMIKSRERLIDYVHEFGSYIVRNDCGHLKIGVRSLKLTCLGKYVPCKLAATMMSLSTGFA